MTNEAKMQPQLM